MLIKLPSYIPETGNILWVVDENGTADLSTIKPYESRSLVLSNRFDIYKALADAGINSVFSDFILPGAQRFDCIVYPVSKEKLVCKHILSCCSEWLKPGGTLVLTGKKNEGIKGWYDKLKKNMPANASLKKHGNDYIAKFIRDESNILSNELDYHRFEHIADLENLALYSKPGVFGWQKIDEGSQFLLDILKANRIDENNTDVNNKKILDLGCGSGFLAISFIAPFAHAAAGMENIEVVATDNNATAVLATQENIQRNKLDEKPGLRFKVLADDCAASLNDKFDLILCNPPFHKGHATSSELTEKFIAGAYRLLNKKGEAWFVVNSFIGVERIAKRYFPSVETVANNNQYKVLVLK